LIIAGGSIARASMLWPLRADTDLSFLMGRELVQVAVGLYRVQFRFDDEVAVSVEDSFTYERPERKDTWKPGELNVAGLALELLGSVIKDVRANGSEVELTFSNGHKVRLDGEPSAYESYTITSRSGVIVV
jgi:uncharacterized protein DUF6188